MKLFSPVFSKEMVTLARRKRHFLARAFLLGALLITIAVGWTVGTRRLRYSGFADLSSLGHSLFETFAWTQLWIVVLLMPALTAPVIAAEKDRDTLGLLLMSNLRRHNILLDKLLSRMVLVIFLLLSGLPLFLVLLAFGGITFGHISVAYMAIFATMFFCSGIGLLFSTLMNRMYSALTASYMAIAAYVFGLILLDTTSRRHLFDIDYFLPLNLNSSCMEETLFFLGLSLVVFAACLLISIVLLPRLTESRKRHWLKRLFHRLNSFFERINFTGITVLDDNRALKKNAILWKEANKSFFGSSTFIIRAGYTMIALSLITLAFIPNWEAATGVVAFFAMVILLMIAVIASATAFASERDRDSFEVMMASPLTARSIVMAKFAGVMKKTVPVLICAVIWFIAARMVIHYYGIGRNRRWLGEGLGLLLISTAQVPLIVVIGLYSGLRHRRTASAILQTVLICGFWSGLPMVTMFLSNAFGMYKSYSGIPYIYYWSLRDLWATTPVGSIMASMEGDSRAHLSAVLIPIWVLLLFILIKRFDRMVGRR